MSTKSLAVDQAGLNIERANFQSVKHCAAIKSVFLERKTVVRALSQLLLDEERPEVRKLPGACCGKDDELNQSPSDNTGVGSLGLVTEFCFAFL